ncbi:MAG: L-aspartate oxidase [Candidatus Diapherotrites archaeon]|nr:L-aspartate oxidase [Candidatus Micrarchaeota archaeon]
MARGKFDLLVIGAGLAGLSAAYAAAEKDKNKTIALVSLDSNYESASMKAQGGIACALGNDDSEKLHMQDTLSAGAGLCDERAVKTMAKDAAPRLRKLREMGLKFDADARNEIDLGIEGGHSARRVLHIDGDATGKGMLEFMHKIAGDKKNIRKIEGKELNELLVSQGRCVGAVIGGHAVLADAVLLATGGFAPLYGNATNPQGNKGSAIAAAFRAGARMQDMEFVQFHPTVMIGQDENYLITESVRGEGAKLVDEKGRQFMQEYSKRGELDTRDVVSRAIFSEIEKGHRIFLDICGLANIDLKKRFPNLHDKIQKEKIDLARGLLPISPAAHYTIGGVKADINGRTNIPGLFAAGECACTGLHGANRLACNSLLEAVVFGQRGGETAIRERGNKVKVVRNEGGRQGQKQTEEQKTKIGELVGKILWERAGIVRSAEGLRTGLREIDKIGKSTETAIAELVLLSALRREESRGVHFRSDFPKMAKRFAQHTII